MSAPINDGGLAFPLVSEFLGHWSGMSMRDYFAAKAMHQFLAGAVLPPGYDASRVFGLAAGRAYEMADAMLKAREGGAA